MYIFPYDKHMKISITMWLKLYHLGETKVLKKYFVPHSNLSTEKNVHISDVWIGEAAKNGCNMAIHIHSDHKVLWYLMVLSPLYPTAEIHHQQYTFLMNN